MEKDNKLGKKLKSEKQSRIEKQLKREKRLKEHYSIKERSKNSVFRIVFGRTFFTLLSVALQVFALILFTIGLREYFIYFYGVTVVLGVALSIRIINKNMNPSFKLSWTMLVLAVPVFGAIFYVMLKIHPSTKAIEKKHRQLCIDTKKYVLQNENILLELKETENDLYGLARYVSDYGGFATHKNTSVKYYALGDDKFEDLLVELYNAKEYIFMEYYIVDEGVMWNSILEILKRKVSEGVEVRFMYDGMCTLKLLPHDYPKQLSKFGIKCKVFSPIRPIISSYQNNRDHRKICVIDGNVAFTGGVNLSDEYINIASKYGHWKDTAVMLKGEAVKNFTLMFLQNWNASEKNTENFKKYIRGNSVSSKGYVLPFGDGPFNKENIGERVYIDILNNAKSYVHIMTPYLVLDNELLKSMEYAAKRGVDVKIIMPHITDNKSAYLIAKNHYPVLIDYGIEIYEYTPGFVHAKTVVSDNSKAVVGTINLDYRSMYLNMECAVYIQGMKEILNIENDYQETLEKCKRITLKDCDNYSFADKTIGKLLSLFSPLM